MQFSPEHSCPPLSNAIYCDLSLDLYGGKTVFIGSCGNSYGQTSTRISQEIGELVDKKIAAMPVQGLGGQPERQDPLIKT